MYQRFLTLVIPGIALSTSEFLICNTRATAQILKVFLGVQIPDGHTADSIQRKIHVTDKK